MAACGRMLVLFPSPCLALGMHRKMCTTDEQAFEKQESDR